MPEFNQQTLNYTTEYSKAMANAYPYWSYFSDLYGSPNSATYKPLGGKAIAVQGMTVSGARSVDRDNLDGKFTRNFNTDQQILGHAGGSYGYARGCDRYDCKHYADLQSVSKNA